MEEKKQPKINFQFANDQDNLSAGVCGPDGCMIDWSKVKKDN